MLAGNPADEPRQIGIGAEQRKIAAHSRQFRIRKSGVQSAMADRMQGHGSFSAPAFRNGVMQFDPSSQIAPAKPA